MSSRSRPAADALREAALIALLQDVVDDGASVGFLPPLSVTEAGEYWDSVFDAVASGARLLWVARTPGEGLAGTVQLDLEKRANGRPPRASSIKLMVAHAAPAGAASRARSCWPRRRRRGASAGARSFLDTRLGDPSEHPATAALGWEFAGSIPRYARSAGGALDANAIYYRLLDALSNPARRAPRRFG